MLRSLLTILNLVCLPAMLFAQGVFSNKTSATLEKVIQDYPNRFRNIKGDLVQQNPQSAEYRSTVQLPGTASGVVTKYSDTKNDVYSWSSLVYEEEDFDKVKSKFKETFEQIRNMIVKIEGEKPFILHGQYQIPTEEKKFTTIILELLPSVGIMKKLKVDLSMQYVITGWKINLSVYDRDRNDDERGAITGN